MEMAYQLQGSSLEACTCEASCPCWAGYEPNEGCDTVLSWHIDTGTIEGVDVSGRAVAVLAGVPCSGLDQGAASATLYVDDEATLQQEDALLNAWTGRLGGPVADLARLFGEVAGVERAPITFSVDGGTGTLRIGQEIQADTAPLREAEGRSTTIHESVLSIAPDSAPDTTAESSEDLRSQQYSVVQASFRFEA
jgi:hypothetical protein